MKFHVRTEHNKPYKGCHLKLGAWDEDRVKELHLVRREAKKAGINIHHARITELCTKRNSESNDGHAATTYKGRDVVLGNNVKDEESMWAVFSDLGSSPPTLDACRALDAVSCLPGYVTKARSTLAAYFQSYLRNEEGILT